MSYTHEDNYINTMLFYGNPERCHFLLTPKYKMGEKFFWFARNILLMDSARQVIWYSFYVLFIKKGFSIFYDHKEKRNS